MVSPIIVHPPVSRTIDILKPQRAPFDKLRAGKGRKKGLFSTRRHQSMKDMNFFFSPCSPCPPWSDRFFAFAPGIISK
jgi:hypothetical protein